MSRLSEPAPAPLKVLVDFHRLELGVPRLRVDASLGFGPEAGARVSSHGRVTVSEMSLNSSARHLRDLCRNYLAFGSCPTVILMGHQSTHGPGPLAFVFGARDTTTMAAIRRLLEIVAYGARSNWLATESDRIETVCIHSSPEAPESPLFFL